MKFSIIMPVLNGERFLAAAIESIRAQGDQDWELIIADGGSTDRSQDIAEGFAQKDARIRLFSEADKGMYDALFKGFAHARGDWIGWLNADDLYAPWALPAVRRHLQTHDSDWVTGLPGCWDSDSVLRSIRPAGRYSRRLIAAGWHHDGLLGFLQQESMFFSRRLLEKLPSEETTQIRAMRAAGDFLMWRLFAKHAALEAIPTVLGGFRRHGDNLSSKQVSVYREEVLSTKPFTLPGLLARPTALAWRMASAWGAVRKADRADRRLLSDIEAGDAT